MLRPGYAELAKTVHSISGSITTVFLFTRLWARSRKHGGLWRDDYICALPFPHLAFPSPTLRILYCTAFLTYTARKVGNQSSANCRHPVIVAWACLLVANGLAAASPVYGFNVLDGTAHGVTIQFSAVSLMDLAIALSKTAFATTLLRLTRARRDKTILWLTIVVVNFFNLAMVVVNWRE